MNEFWATFQHTTVYVTAGVSLFVAVVLVSVYVARRLLPTLRRLREEREMELAYEQESNPTSTRRSIPASIPSTTRGSFGAAAANPPAAGAAVGLLMPGLPPGTEPKRWDHWPATRSFGLDLGSNSIKVASFKGDALRRTGTVRCVACLTRSDGLVVGDVDAAIDHHPSAFMSCLRSLAYDPAKPVAHDGVAFPAAQVMGALLRHAVGERSSGLPLVGLSVAPQFGAAAHLLYLSALSAGLERFFMFHQAAALIAALLKYRSATTGKAKPARLVVFADAGESGVSGYVSEVRESSGSVLAQAWRPGGMETSVEAMHRGLVERLRAVPDEMTSYKIAEAADELRQEFSELPEHLARTRKVSKTVDDEITIAMDREDFVQWFQPALQDVTSVATDLKEYLKSHASLHGNEGVELVLTGGMFLLPDVRDAFVKPLEGFRRGGVSTVTHGKVSVAEGVALLAAMRHPDFAGQRYDIAPLYLQRTVDESGYRELVDDRNSSSHGRSSVLTPFLKRSSSGFVRPGPAQQRRKASALM